MRQSKKIIAIILAGCLAVGLSACSTHRGTTSSQDVVEVGGMREELGGFSTAAANRMRSAVNQSYYFDFDVSRIAMEDIASIRVQGEYLIKYPNSQIRLEGNADERGSREYNVALGYRRAQAVAKILQQMGVHQTQIAIVSFGKEKPIALGHDEDSHARNRRVDLIYEVK